MPEIIVKPVGIVHNCRTEPVDDHWSSIESVIELSDDLPGECLDGIEQFSHLEVIYHFNKSEKTVTGSEYPRENLLFPKTGIFAQRKKDRPNHLGTTIVKLVRREGRRLFVKNLDAIDGSPVIDIKPVFKEYLPQEEIRQPEWTRKIMKNYW
jgi:tRNA (adenine37-N6)-methyltransferase